MVKFSGMVIDGHFCATPQEAADRAGVSVEAIYYRVRIGWRDGDPTGSNYVPVKYRNIRYRGKDYATVQAAVTAEGVSRQAVYQYMRRSGQMGDQGDGA